MKARTWRSVVRNRFLLFPLLTPAVLLTAGNDGFGFDAPGFVDPFAYLGNFWHYAEHLPRFDGDYRISRLPWVLPGFAAHAVGGEIVGAYILNYLTMAAAAVALYLLVRDAINDRETASVVAVAWACCTPSHGVGGWNYHVLAAGAYYLAACWLVLRAARGPSSQRAAFLAGVLLACAVHTHLFLVAYFPLVALLYWSALPPAQVAYRPEFSPCGLTGHRCFGCHHRAHGGQRRDGRGVVVLRKPDRLHRTRDAVRQ